MREMRLRGNRNRQISVVRVRHATDNAPPKRSLIVGSGGLPYSLRQYTIPRYNEPDFASALYRLKGGRHGRYSFGRGRGPSARSLRVVPPNGRARYPLCGVHGTSTRSPLYTTNRRPPVHRFESKRRDRSRLIAGRQSRGNAARTES